MSRKKIILISLLAITVIVSSFVAFHFFSNDSSSKVDTSKQLKTNFLVTIVAQKLIHLNNLKLI